MLAGTEIRLNAKLSANTIENKRNYADPQRADCFTFE
jgi:hypothetical protein